MRVLIDAVSAPGDPRGVGRYTRGLTLGLAAQPGAQVVLAHGPWHADFYAPLTALGVTLLPVHLATGSTLSRHLWHARQLASAARDARADVIHVVDRVPARAAQGVPLVVTLHDVAEVDRPDAFGQLQRRYRRLVLAQQLRAATRFVVPSEFSRQRLERLNPAAARRSAVVPSGPGIGPETEAVPPRAPIEAPFLLCVGALQRHKNLPRVVRAFRELRGDSLRLVLAGADHNDAAAVAAATGTDGRIVRLRDTSDGEVAWLYRHAAGLVFPSTYEGFGLPVLEAMSVGCPVITSDRGAMREVAGAAALLVDPFDQNAIRDAMQRLLDEPQLGAGLAAAGLDRARAFTWESAAAGTLAVYRTALDTSGRDGRS